MKIKVSIIAALIVGVVIGAVGLREMIPGMMIQERQSSLSFDATVERIQTNAQENGWMIPKVHNLRKSLMAHGYDDVGGMAVIEMCKPDYSSIILSDDSQKSVSVMMPCAVAVYEKQDGTTWISTMRSDKMGALLGGNVKTAMSGVYSEEPKLFDFVQ